MKKYIIIFALFICAATECMYAQSSSEKITVAGTVMDEKGEVLIGVSVSSKGNPRGGTQTDIDGKFRLQNLQKNTVLVFSFVGFNSYEEPITKTKENLKIVLKAKVNSLEEVVVVGQGTQRKISVVGAVTNIDPLQLQVPATSVTNMLGGRVPGIIAVPVVGNPEKISLNSGYVESVLSERIRVHWF